MQLVNVFIVNIAYSYMIKSFLNLLNGNVFTEAETGEPPISRQNALECTKSHIKYQTFSGGNTPGPRPLGALPPDPRKGKEGKEGRGRKKRGGAGKGRKGHERKGKKVVGLEG